MKKTCKLYRFAATVISACMLCGTMPVIPGQSAEEPAIKDDSLLSFDVLREMFPKGRYWNHMGSDQNDPKKTTDIPCDHTANGSKYCNKSYQYDYQCYGYAQELALLMYGTRFREWERDKNMDNLKPGDVLVFDYVGQFGGHTVMVIGVEDDLVYFTDCNTGNTCRIGWDSYHSKEYFSSGFTEEPGKVCINGVYHAPYEAPEHFVETGHTMTKEEAAGQTLPDGDYRIVSSLKRNFFLNHAESTEPGEDANVQMKQYPYQELPGPNDIWEVTYQDNGFYTIREKASGQYLSVSNDSTESRTNVVLREQDDSDTQLWSVSVTDQGYGIRSKCGAWYLNVESMLVEDGRNVQVWINDCTVQSWGFIPEPDTDADTIPMDMYYIRSVSDPECYLYVTRLDAQQVILYKCRVDLSEEKKDAFLISRFHSDENGYGIVFPYSERNLYMDFYADFSWEDHLKEGCNISLYYGDAPENRQSLYWNFRPAGDGSYYLVCNAGGYYLTSDLDANSEKSTEPEFDEAGYEIIRTDLSQRHFTGADNQKWILERVKVPGDRIDGDVNEDGVCDQKDAVALQKWLLARLRIGPSDWLAGDLNHDEKLTAADLTMLKQIIQST